jgi:hypothetical protein
MSKKLVIGIALLILIITVLASSYAKAATVPLIPTYPGSEIIEWPLHDAPIEKLIAKRVVMKVKGEQTAGSQEFEEMLANDGWQRGHLCRNGPAVQLRHLSGPLPWSHEWTATVDYNDMGNDTTYVVVTIYTVSQLPGDCESMGDL